MSEFHKTSVFGKGIRPLDVYAEHAEIRAQVYNEIKKLNYTLSTHVILQSISTTINTFLDCLIPLKNLYDPGRLPIYRTKPVSPISDKRSCVWALVSCLVQAYWMYESKDGDERHKSIVLEYLDQLKNINEHYPEMKVVGADNKGYWLEL